jgi:hypothetical protein
MSVVVTVKFVAHAHKVLEFFITRFKRGTKVDVLLAKLVIDHSVQLATHD